MEVLKSGDAPALVTNLELLELLRERAAARERGANGHSGAAAEDATAADAVGPFRHRDWIERTVLDHLAASPVGGAGIQADAMPDLVARLRRAPGFPPAVVRIKEEAGAAPASAAGYGLTDGETLQVLNHFPTSLVDVHLLIEDVENRAPLNDEEKQSGFLRLVSEFSGRPAEVCDGEDDAAPMDEDEDEE